MRNICLLLCATLLTGMVAAQTIEIFPNAVQGLNKTFHLNATYGQSSTPRSVWLSNRTPQIVQVFARPHLEGDALYCMDKQGKTSREFTLELRPGTTLALDMFGFLDEGGARLCEGYIALAITPLQADGSKGATRTVKLPAAVQFKNEKTAAAPTSAPARKTAPQRSAPVENTQPQKPDRYDYIHYEGLPMRWHAYQLPLKVYSAHGNTGDTAQQYASVVQRVVEIWNAVGRKSELKKDFFQIVQRPGGADIRLQWTGANLLPGSQGTAYPTDGKVCMNPLQRYEGLGSAGETLLQEMCHMLGVEHSEVASDIMYHQARRYSPALFKLAVTARDEQMLMWLYSQKKYVSFRG